MDGIHLERPDPYLRVLGHPVLEAGTEEHPLSPERRHQLIAYLACRDGWVPRTEVAALFWGGRTRDDGRRNLRKLLHDIRRIPWVTMLECRADSLRLRVRSDLGDFAAAHARKDWSALVRLGRGTLLEGIERGATEPFAEWLGYERELQLRKWREGVGRLREQLRGDPQGRVELDQWVLKRDPHDEATVADLVEALRALGREAEARKAWARFVRRLKDDLGVEPTLEVRPSGDATAARPPVAALPDLVGRRLEHAELLALLRRDDCRRLTIHGPGGVGKSSLARAVQGQLAADFRDGVFWVGLEDVAGPDSLAARVAEACGFRIPLSGDPVQVLAERLGAREALLIFDNCEHLPQVAPAGDLLVERCPRLKILHTSRAKVGCRGEWVLPLEMLAVPDLDEDDWDVLSTYDSVRLFELRAIRHDPGFDARRQRRAVAELVRRLEGLPLAIEMAAACVRLLPVEEMVRDLSRIVDLQDRLTPSPGGPRPDRTLRASFEHSWRLLAPQERATLARLAVFGGGFSLGAATRVARAGLAVVASLADKSLVGCSGNGRFSLHPLVRQLALEHVGDATALRRRHAVYFAAVMGRAGSGAAGLGEEEVSACLDAWRWATGQRAVGLLRRMAVPLVRLVNAYLRWHEGIEVIEATLAAVTGSAARCQRLRATLLHGLAVCRLYSGELRAAEAAARQSLRLCHALRAGECVAGNLYVLGFSLAWRGEAAQARRFFIQLERAARRCRDAEGIAKASYGLAFLEQAAGQWALAAGTYAENAAFCRDNALPQWRSLSLNGLGKARAAQGRWREALSAFDEGVRVCAESEVHGRRAFLLVGRGLALLRLGELALAERSIEQALREANEWSIWTARVDAHLARCSLALERGDTALAQEQLREATAIARRHESAVRRLAVLRHWGDLLLRIGEGALARSVLCFVRDDARALRSDRDAAEALLAQAPGLGDAWEPAASLEALEGSLAGRSRAPCAPRLA